MSGRGARRLQLGDTLPGGPGPIHTGDRGRGYTHFTAAGNSETPMVTGRLCAQVTDTEGPLLRGPRRPCGEKAGATMKNEVGLDPAFRPSPESPPAAAEWEAVGGLFASLPGPQCPQSRRAQSRHSGTSAGRGPCAAPALPWSCGLSQAAASQKQIISSVTASAWHRPLERSPWCL